VHDQQLTVVGAVVYHSYGAHLFTAQIATHQLLLAYADYRTCHRNSATPRIRHQQSVVSLVCHLISSGDMIPLCGTSSERHHTHIGCYQPDPRACGRRRSVLGLFWSDLEYTTVSLATESWRMDSTVLDWDCTVDCRSRTPIIAPLRNDVHWLHVKP